MFTRIVYTQIWVDEFFINLSSPEKLLFLYFLTNDQVNIIHLYQCPINRIAADTGIDRGIIEEAKKKFEEAGKIYFKGNFIFLKNAFKYEKYEGIKNQKAKEKLLSFLPQEILDWYNNLIYRGINRGIDRVISNHRIPSINHKSEIINHKSEIINHKSKIVNQKEKEIYKEKEKVLEKSAAFEKFKLSLRKKGVIRAKHKGRNEEKEVFDNPVDKALVEKANQVEAYYSPHKTAGYLLALFFFFFVLVQPLAAKTVTVIYRISSPHSPQSQRLVQPKNIGEKAAGSVVSDYSRQSGQSGPDRRPTTGGSIENKILQVFGRYGSAMLAVAKCESGLRPNAVNWHDSKITGMPSLGIFQLNRAYDEKYFDPDFNIWQAKELFDRRGFQPWINCSKKFGFL